MSKNLKFGVGITFFYPSDENLLKVIELSQSFDKVYIYDNSSRKMPYQTYLSNIKNVHYITESKNNGLPKAFNKIIDISIKQVDYLCMLDQDSRLENINITRLKEFICKHDQDNIGIIAPRIQYGTEKEVEKNMPAFIEKKWVIASGSFIRLKSIVEKKIYFDENYFIDRFDADFCKQLNLKKLKVIVYNFAQLKQNLGEQGYFNHSQHHAFRHYYIARNRLYFNMKYYSIPKALAISLLQTMHHFYYILLFEENKSKKMIMCIKGIIDYFSGHMGCI